MKQAVVVRLPCFQPCVLAGQMTPDRCDGRYQRAQVGQARGRAWQERGKEPLPLEFDQLADQEASDRNVGQRGLGKRVIHSDLDRTIRNRGLILRLAGADRKGRRQSGPDPMQRIACATEDRIAPDLRQELKKIGVRAGRFALFIPDLLKPRATARRAAIARETETLEGEWLELSEKLEAA